MMDVSSIFSVLATVLAGAEAASPDVRAATASFVHTLLTLVHHGFAADLGRIKESHIVRLEGRAAEASAEAFRKTVDAVERANQLIASCRTEIARGSQGGYHNESPDEPSGGESATLDDKRRAEARLLEIIKKLGQSGAVLIIDTRAFEQPPRSGDQSASQDPQNRGRR